jgi:hypothetical protein
MKTETPWERIVSAPMKRTDTAIEVRRVPQPDAS